MMPFISTSDLGEFLGQDVTDDQLAIIAIDSACEVIRSYCGQRLNYLADETITLNGDGLVLMLPELPVVVVSAVAEDDVALEATDFYSTRMGVLYRTSGIWSAGLQNIVVTYSHGYAVNESDVELDPTDDTPLPDRMPSDIRRVALGLAQRIFVSSGTVVGTKASETIGPDSYSYTLANSTSSGTVSVSSASQFGPDEKAILDLHRFSRVA